VDPVLRRLIERMPPPANPTGRKVEWKQFEDGLDLKYPASFKDFIGVYGATIWFDDFTPFYPEVTTTKDVKSFLRSVHAKLKLVADAPVYDEEFQSLELPPLYPDKGGLFPFMADYSSYEYYWKTGNKDPEKWPIVCWKCGVLVVLEKTSIAKMFLDFLERKPRMVKLWGDIKEFPPERIQLDRWVPPPAPKQRKR
jgi:hypothetical protein